MAATSLVTTFAYLLLAFTCLLARLPVQVYLLCFLACLIACLMCEKREVGWNVELSMVGITIELGFLALWYHCLALR